MMTMAWEWIIFPHTLFNLTKKEGVRYRRERNVYFKITKNAGNSYIRRVAVEKLTDWNVLADIAKK